MENLVSPIKPEVFKRILAKFDYPKEKIAELYEGFKNGFSLQYEGEKEVRRTSNNLRFMPGVGDKIELWNKVMNEVKEKRYAGPYKEPPFDYFVQSPIGLVPKDGGKKTRLIFHLSHPRKNPEESVNFNTPREYCEVQYPDFDDAVKRCIEEGIYCKAAKSDLVSAFRHCPIRKEDWYLLVMKCENPVDGQTYYFVDKCLPFGHAISCAIFQKVSDGISFAVEKTTAKKNINYLDDFFFVDRNKTLCDRQVYVFLDICGEIGFPVSIEKTQFATEKLSFLGLLMNTVLRVVCIPVEKIIKLEKLLDYYLAKKSKKLKIRELQQICGHLNFVCRAIVPGRAF